MSNDTCKRCNGIMYFQAPVILAMPMKYFYKVSKSAVRDKDSKLMGVQWEQAHTIYCEGCGFDNARESDVT